MICWSVKFDLNNLVWVEFLNNGFIQIQFKFQQSVIFDSC